MELKNTTLEWHDTSKELPMEHEAITFWRKDDNDFEGLTIGCGMYESGQFHDMFSWRKENGQKFNPRNRSYARRGAGRRI